jgi:hypothetical protein
MKRLATLGALGAVLAACGGGGTTTVAVRVFSPAGSNSDLYVVFQGSAGAARASRHAAIQEFKNSSFGGFIVAPAAHGRQDCSFTRTIRPNTLPSLRKYAGQKLAVSVYGTSTFAPTICDGMRAGLASG